MKYQNHCPYQVWIRDGQYFGGVPYEVHYGRYIIASFVRKELAVAYRDWFCSRRDLYLTDTRLGRFTLEELIFLRATYPRRGGNNV